MYLYIQLFVTSVNMCDEVVEGKKNFFLKNSPHFHQSMYRILPVPIPTSSSLKQGRLGISSCEHRRTRVTSTNLTSYAIPLKDSNMYIDSESTAKKPLVVVGSVNADLVIEVDRLPKPGETLSGSSMNVYPGGKGANQAAAAAKLGYPTHFVGQVGRDAYASMLRSALRDCNVDISKLYSVDGSSGIAFIMLQPDGENSIVLVGGANTSEEWQITDEVTAAIQDAGAVLLQREITETVNVIFAKVIQDLDDVLLSLI